ncbi:MAG: hypothetical protein HYX42_21115 [Polaromonas sp.]|uniref:hypothetical protein n=1 Tax=Polaromonas sp. TaxID=1869339 RepID=UPI0025E553EE|nr:hypothetical protein [Polaromonas sp.]MBI2728749.1 hypothetical protein [Polaromonas sp.]
MTFVRTQQFQTYPPRTISRGTFRALVDALKEFRPGLITTDRKIKAQAISHGKITNLEGPESWKVLDEHSLSELEHLQVEMLLTASPTESCELHIEFRGNHVALSVSDIKTGWGKAVFEEARHLLELYEISLRGWKQSFIRTYQLVEILQTPLMVLAAAVFAVWLKYGGVNYAYAAVGFMLSGVIPTLRTLWRFFRPAKRIQIVQEADPKVPKFPWMEASSVLAFIASVLSLTKEVITWLGTK